MPDARENIEAACRNLEQSLSASLTAILVEAVKDAVEAERAACAEIAAAEYDEAKRTHADEAMEAAAQIQNRILARGARED